MNNLIIVTGMDRTGKSTIIKDIDSRIYTTRKFNTHSGKPPESEYVNYWSKCHYLNLLETFDNLIVKNNYTVICDRFYEGEYVYGVLYRNQDETILDFFENLDVFENLNKNSKIKLVMMYDSINNLMTRDDQHSLEKNIDEMNRTYIRFFNFFCNTRIRNKLMYKLTDDRKVLFDFLEL